MDAKILLIACLVALPQVGRADSAPDQRDIIRPPSGTPNLQQPDWIRTPKTIRLARLPESQQDIGELLADSVLDPTEEPAAPYRDANVVPAAASIVTSDPQRAQKLLDDARTLAKHSTELADFERVLDLCHAAIEAGPTPNQAASLARFGAWASNGRGECLLQLGNEHAAFEAFQESLLLDPNCWEALHNRGVTLAANGRPQEALNDFTRVVALAPNFGSAYRNRGELYAAHGKVQLALADYTRAIELEPESATHRYSRALVYHQLDQLAETVKDLNAAVQLAEAWDAPLVLRADIYQSLGYWEKSMEDYRTALAANPRCQPAYQGLAWLLSTCPNPRYRNATTALEAAQRAKRLGDANDWELLDTVAAAYAEAGQYEQAITLVEQAIVLAGDDATEDLGKRLAFYRSNRPYRLSVKP